MVSVFGNFLEIKEPLVWFLQNFRTKNLHQVPVFPTTLTQNRPLYKKGFFMRKMAQIRHILKEKEKPNHQIGMISSSRILGFLFYFHINT